MLSNHDVLGRLPLCSGIISWMRSFCRHGDGFRIMCLNFDRFCLVIAFRKSVCNPAFCSFVCSLFSPRHHEILTVCLSPFISTAFALHLLSSQSNSYSHFDVNVITVPHFLQRDADTLRLLVLLGSGAIVTRNAV